MWASFKDHFKTGMSTLVQLENRKVLYILKSRRRNFRTIVYGPLSFPIFFNADIPNLVITNISHLQHVKKRLYSFIAIVATHLEFSHKNVFSNIKDFRFQTIFKSLFAEPFKIYVGLTLKNYFWGKLFCNALPKLSYTSTQPCHYRNL